MSKLLESELLVLHEILEHLEISELELFDNLNLSRGTIIKCHKSLRDKGLIKEQ